MVLSIQENYITKHYRLALQNSFHEQKTSPRLTRPLGDGMSFNGITMAQSPGDGNSRGLCLLQITTQEILSLGKLSRLEHLHLGGFVTCCGLRVLRALRDLGRWWFSWATAGVRPLRNSNSSNSLRRFPRLFLVRLLQHKRSMASHVPTFIAP